jgi:trans-2,3-dihydro-3-hydroxyanthranilate isomerase
MLKECVFIDVFAEDPYTGNPLTVFTDGEELTRGEMQMIAREIAGSQTAFILPSDTERAHARLRVFTSTEEVPFAGHPVLGAAATMLLEGIVMPDDDGTIVLSMAAGEIPITRKEVGDKLIFCMEQLPPSFEEIQCDRKLLAEALMLHERDLDDELPVEAISTGLPFIIIPIKSLEAISRAAVVMPKWDKAFGKLPSFHAFLTCREGSQDGVHLHNRLFAPRIGVLEDPATGSGSGCLVAYLLKHNVYGKELGLVAEQGIEIERPSLLHLEGVLSKRGYTIRVGGSVSPVGRGTFEIPW